MDTWTHRFTAVRRVDSLTKEYGRKLAKMRVEAGLHQLGEQRPYFSVTADIYSPSHPDSPFACGCMHDEVLRFWPKLAPVVALHLSDDTGMPMHAEANGWHQLAGYYGGAGEQYHAGNSKGHYGGEYRLPTPDECLAQFAEHVRISVDDARRLADGWKAVDVDDAKLPRVLFASWLQGQAARFQAEADAAIALLDSLSGR